MSNNDFIIENLVDDKGSLGTAQAVGAKQPKITATGILKGDGSGNVSAAVAGTDYLGPDAIDEVKETVTDWLDEHVDPETGYVIDDSLTIQGAAADAKAVGDTMLTKEAFSQYKKFGMYNNILPIDDKAQATTNDVVWSRTNGEYSFNGTASGNVQINLAGSSSTVPDGLVPGKTYYIDSGLTGDVKLQLRIYGYQSGTSEELVRFTTSTSTRGLWTVPSGYDGFQVRWYMAKNNSLTNYKAAPTISEWFSNKELSDSVFSEGKIAFPFDGYVQVSSGEWHDPNSTYKEVTSYMIYGVDEFQAVLGFASSENHYVQVNVYDKNGGWIGGRVLDTSTASSSTVYCNLKDLGQNAVSFRLGYRSFGESCTCAIKLLANAARTASALSEFMEAANDQFAGAGPVEANKIRSSLGSSLLRFDKYIDHLWSDGANGTNVKVPWESLTSVRLSKRMGFKCIEANVHALSDGNYLVIHGSTTPGYEAFGNSVEHVDGETDISAVAFADVTLAWVKENVRYKCVVPKYRVAPPSLQEFLRECKTLGIVAYVQAVSSDFATLKPELDICNEIMGKDNYILYVRPDGGNETIRNYTSAPLARWASLSTKDGIVAWVQANQPCLYGMSNYTDFTDEQLLEIVNAVHTNGGLIGSAYLSETNRVRLIGLGFDYVSTKYNINDIESGNLCNLAADLAFTDFSTTGTVADNVLTLAAGETVSLATELDSSYLSGANLEIVFDGTITVDFGDFIDGVELTSNGSTVIPLSTYFIGTAPTFTITAVSSTDISSLTFKASKF